MAYQTRFIATMGRSLHKESLKSLHQFGSLITKRNQPIIPSQMGRLGMPSSQPRHYEGEDPYLTVLDWRNTPSASIKTSPVQRLFGRRTKTPAANSWNTAPTQAWLWKVGRTSWKKKRDIKNAITTHEGTRQVVMVRMRPLLTDKEKLWKKATVIKQVAPRSYKVDL